MITWSIAGYIRTLLVVIVQHSSSGSLPLLDTKKRSSEV